MTFTATTHCRRNRTKMVTSGIKKLHSSAVSSHTSVTLQGRKCSCVFTVTASLFRSAQYFASTMMIVGLSVVVTVLVLQFHHHDPRGGKMPKWVGLKRQCKIDAGEEEKHLGAQGSISDTVALETADSPFFCRKIGVN